MKTACFQSENRPASHCSIGRRCLLFLGLTIVLGACVEDDGKAIDEPTPTEESTNEGVLAIRGADGGGSSTFTVGIYSYAVEVGGSGSYSPKCTGTALSRHWILTAAHCLSFEKLGTVYEVTQGEIYRQKSSGSTLREYVFGGEYDIFVPSQWNPVTMPMQYDIGLIRLHGDGMDPAPLSWSRLYSGPSDDLLDYLEEDRIKVTGWGRGNYDPNNISCDLTSLKPRYGQLSVVSLSNGVVIGNQDQSDAICVGDSGGPWWNKLDGSSYMLQFGITSRAGANASLSECGGKCFDYNTQVKALYTGDWINWIESQSASTPVPLDCRNHTSGGWRYHRCYE